MSHHSYVLLHDQDAFRAESHAFPLLSRFSRNFVYRLLQENVLLFLRHHVVLELLVVLVDLRLAVLLHVLHFLDKLLHKSVSFAPKQLCLLLEGGEQLVPEHHLLLNVLNRLVHRVGRLRFQLARRTASLLGEGAHAENSDARGHGSLEFGGARLVGLPLVETLGREHVHEGVTVGVPCLEWPSLEMGKKGVSGYMLNSRGG